MINIFKGFLNMATSSRQSALFGVNDWKRIYQTYREADFMSYDYETLRKSFIDYLTQYYPETFNDYTESSEFVALLDVMAFMGQGLAFRSDLNARENFIDTAERRDSVIKLANLVSYTPKRNLAGQGLIKITAVATTENVLDINGANLGNTTVLWNDPANPNWQEQFNSIVNSAMVNSQRVGRPGNSQNILGVKTDEYSISIPPGQLPVAPYLTQVDGINMSFELVSATSLNSDSLYELPPAPSGQFNMLYRNDKLGYGSPNTGFFFYFKQGALKNAKFNFAEQIENNFQQIDIQNINNTDTWLYGLDDAGSIQDYWTKVDNIFVNANLQGSSSRKIYSVTSRTNDQVTYVFGDGVFGEIPIGAFSAYVRESNGLTYTINPSEMNGIVINLQYVSRTNRIETLTFTVSLQSNVNNALQRESLTQIKERAPSRYYTQNRMVNGEDYTNFPFTLYNSIVKSKALNRSSIGVSRNQDLLDPTGKYSSTNVFGADGALYSSDVDSTSTFSALNINLAVEFLSQTLPVLLSAPEVIQYYLEFFTRYSGQYNSTGSIDNVCYWKRLTVSDTSVTGYFYILTSSGELPIPVGTANSTNMTYITEGAQLKFLAPAGKYFDQNNRLQDGTASVSNGGRSYIWVGVNSVIGDGCNNGVGALSNGTGPVTLSGFIPSSAYLDNTTGTWNPASNTGATGIIPSFDNTLSTTVVREVLNLVELKTSGFVLNYDNTIPAAQTRWSLTTSDPTVPNSLILFTYNVADDSYTVTIKNRTYYYGSVSEVRFLYDREKKVFDPKSGKVLSDYINVFKTNSNPNYPTSSSTPILSIDYPLFVTGQQIESDGYPDDYAVKVSSIDINTSISYDPDFFDTIVGVTGQRYVFFKIITDVADLYRNQLLPVNSVIYAYPTYAAIEAIKYEYPQNTIFYATATGLFYESSLVPGSQPPVLVLTDVSSGYTVATGRNDIDFQYRHNSSNTTRIDPATTNIIDLYVVTQSYYTQYQNWLNDSTGTVIEPPKPTINELQQEYSNLDNYKMLSDSIILNSVTFKPLFGSKAAPALQGTLKVVKSPATTASDSQIRSSMLAALNSYFTLDKWDFGDTFYFSELSAYLHVQLAGLISSVVVVSNNPNQTFGDLYEIRSAPNEIFVNGATVSDITVISSLTPSNLQR
jgi:hypothetical protein